MRGNLEYFFEITYLQKFKSKRRILTINFLMFFNEIFNALYLYFHLNYTFSCIYIKKQNGVILHRT